MLITERRIEKRTGSEGPRHDPYGFEELMVTVNGMVITLHMGLGTWLKVWVSKEEHFTLREGQGFKEEELLVGFERLTGLSPDQAEMIYMRVHECPPRCPKCGRKRFDTEDGYPGETLTICLHCREIVGTHFNPKAIE